MDSAQLFDRLLAAMMDDSPPPPRYSRTKGDNQ